MQEVLLAQEQILSVAMQRLKTPIVLLKSLLEGSTSPELEKETVLQHINNLWCALSGIDNDFQQLLHNDAKAVLSSDRLGGPAIFQGTAAGGRGHHQIPPKREPDGAVIEPSETASNNGQSLVTSVPPESDTLRHSFFRMTESSQKLSRRVEARRALMEAQRSSHSQAGHRTGILVATQPLELPSNPNIEEDRSSFTLSQ